MVRVGITFATALVPVAIFSIYVLLKWKSISGGASIGGVISYFGGIFMRLGAPLSVCSVIASCYFVFRRDIVGIFLAFATFGPILAGGVISMLGMDVNPYYVAYVIFPAIVLCCSFICKLFSLRTADQPATALPFYEIALCTATVSLFIVGSIAELTSHYIDGGRHDWPTAVRWLDKEHGKGGTIAVCQSPGFLVDYCRLSGIPYAIFPADKPLDDIIEAMQSGRFVVMPYVWWATLADGDLDRLLQVPHRIILKAERDGLTPILPTRIRLESYGTEFTNAGRDLKNLVMSKYELKNRIGKTRLDYGQNYLLIYGVRGEASKD